MAKTIMIANGTYDKLKGMKLAREISFTAVIEEMMNNNRSKTGSGLRKHVGILKGDREFKKVVKELEEDWKRWSEEYA